MQSCIREQPSLTQFILNQRTKIYMMYGQLDGRKTISNNYVSEVEIKFEFRFLFPVLSIGLVGSLFFPLQQVKDEFQIVSGSMS